MCISRVSRLRRPRRLPTLSTHGLLLPLPPPRSAMLTFLQALLLLFTTLGVVHPLNIRLRKWFSSVPVAKALLQTAAILWHRSLRLELSQRMAPLCLLPFLLTLWLFNSMGTVA